MTDEELDRRFEHHPPADMKTVTRHEAVRGLCRSLAEGLDFHCPDGREKALALTKLEEVMFWANASVARQGA